MNLFIGNRLLHTKLSMFLEFEINNEEKVFEEKVCWQKDKERLGKLNLN